MLCVVSFVFLLRLLERDSTEIKYPSKEMAPSLSNLIKYRFLKTIVYKKLSLETIKLLIFVSRLESFISLT